MPMLGENCAAAAADGPGCWCLPFCFWDGSGSRGAESGGAGAAPGKRRRRRRRFRRRLRLSWFTFAAWPWLRKKRKQGDGNGEKKGKNQRGRRLLLLLTTSLQAKKALASVVSGDGTLLPAKVSSFGDAKKQSSRKPRPIAADDAAPSGTRQPQQSSMTATALARPATSQPCPKPPNYEPATAGHIWRAPSRRHSLHQPGRAERPAGAGGLWTAATTLGVIVLFGRVTAVVFLCSCLYGARFVRLRAAGASESAKAKSTTGVAGGSGSSRRFGDPVGVAAEVVVDTCTTECKKKVIMAGLLDRAGKRPSSRFGR